MKIGFNVNWKMENPFMGGGFIRYYSTRNFHKIFIKKILLLLSVTHLSVTHFYECNSHLDVLPSLSYTFLCI